MFLYHSCIPFSVVLFLFLKLFDGLHKTIKSYFTFTFRVNFDRFEIRYADVTVLMLQTERKLKEVPDKVVN